MRNQVAVKVLLSFLIFAVFCSLAEANDTSWPYANETKEQRNQRMDWWRDARFGMFIHWGVYSVPAGIYKGHKVKGIGEWIMNRGKIPVAEYKEYAEGFNPVNYDPDKWVMLAKNAGIKYIVITSKHHDGFALYNSKVTDWDVVDATPYGKDLLKPLAEACKKHGIKLGFYYSQAQDWCHKGGAVMRVPAKAGWDNPDHEKIDKFTAEHSGHWDPAQLGSMDEYIKNIAAPQVREILTNYGDIAVLWWDTPVDMNKERADMLQPLISLQPGIITNNRLGGGYPGDLKTPEQHIPAKGLDYDWEACMTMNDTWGFKSYDHNWKSAKNLIRNLVDIASKGGNYLLNVGPTSKGEIPQESVERLKEIGKWMSVNSRSIYETTASPFAKLSWGRCTKKTYINGADLYLHIFDWPEDGKLILPGLKNKVQQAYLLENMKKLKAASVSDGVMVELPSEPLNEIDTVAVLKVKGELDIDKIIPSANAQGEIVLKAELANIHNPGYGSKAKLETINSKKNIGFWTDARVWIEWPFEVEKKAEFSVKTDVALTDKASEITIEIDDKKYRAELNPTGSYSNFKTVSIVDKITLNPGEHRLKIRPLRGKWSPVNLRDVTLKSLKISGR
ncbi:Alpha-L-fucosidase [Sedimentisphaera cyanobacteriorum]|uniref:alpha-L-fucosidase n=1 Tax=Sedimentisphaera cyanobacteriorum TaxID=1940790 RepID=A0A1Q2HQG8_9BACT|nr:alpha-L-fucosidase [Sedimentisphaera cyanobacteriorum]AQQ09485.1 Alpha-L-fucosidase [Sedimentisphaera cyanobacteriorum]